MTPSTNSNRPLLSVVIPTWNSATVLPVALKSLAEQTCRDFEVIISDGASTDDTVSMAWHSGTHLPSLRVDSRPDSGIYDAVNRGVVQAQGDWFLVLGSDDRLAAPDTLATVAKCLKANDGAQVIYGDVRMMAVNLCDVPPGGRYAGPMPLKRLFSTNICQQCVFYRRGLFDTLGGFDIRYKLYADWAFNLRAFFRVSTRWIDVVVSEYAATGTSASAIDTLFLDDLPELIRDELMSRPEQRALWPLHHQVLRIANRLRRHGNREKARVLFCSYLYLLGRRVPVLLRRAP